MSGLTATSNQTVTVANGWVNLFNNVTTANIYINNGEPYEIAFTTTNSPPTAGIVGERHTDRMYSTGVVTGYLWIKAISASLNIVLTTIGA